MEEEILTGGRVTAQVVRRGEFVHRTPCKNAAFVHQVLEFLEAGGVEGVPRYRGLDQQGREVLTFLPGQVPPDLGFFTQAQCCQAVERMKAFHSCLRDFPGCPPGWIVCHNDLSPCNYVFQEGRPVGIIDWDAAAFGHPLDDLAYALWLWLDLGNEEYSYATVRQRMGVMLDAYGVAAGERPGMGERIHRQMERVAQSVFPTPQQTSATSRGSGAFGTASTRGACNRKEQKEGRLAKGIGEVGAVHHLGGVLGVGVQAAGAAPYTPQTKKRLDQRSGRFCRDRS